MLMEVKNNLKFFLNAIKCSIASAMEYKISFITSTIFMFINNGFFLVFWTVIFKANNNSLNGITFDSILYLWSIPVIGFGVAHFFLGGVSNINKYIITSEMDSYMLQPKHPLFNILTSKCNFSAFGDILYGIVLGLVVTKFNVLHFLLLLFLGVFSGIFYIATNVILRSLSVWLGDTEMISKKYNDNLLLQFSIYPEKLFGGLLKVLLYTLVPVGYMAYLPINIMISFNLFYLIITVLVGIIYMCIAIYIFNKAMTKYESGNTIAMRS